MQASSLEKSKIHSYGIVGCRILYITGIQSVRIVKRLRRRTVRFFAPVVELAKLVYAKTLGKQILRLKREFKTFQDNFRRDGEHLKELSKGLTLKGFFGGLQQAGLHFVIRRQFVASVLNVAAPVLATFILIGTVSYWNNQEYGLVLNYGGKTIATIKDESVFEQATEMVNQRMVHGTETSADLKITPMFLLTAMDSGRFYAASTLCDRLIQQSNGIIEEGSGLYVDGQLIGAVKSSADMTYILQNILNTAKGGDLEAKVTFSEDVETINGLFPTSSIITAQNMSEKLTGSEQRVSTYSVRSGDTATSIAQKHNLTLSELNRLNNNQVGDSLKIGMQLNVQMPQTLLNVKVIKKDIYRSSLPYKTVTEKDDSQYTDYSKVVTAGQNGVQEITDEVTYINGVETSRTTLNRQTITEAVDRKVITGTKKRPQYSGSGESSGSLMWPVPSIKNITSYFAYRWGSMHTGIDISGGNSYGKTIVAADGGTVTYVRYSNSGYGNHLQINHGNGTSTLYGHTSKILVSSGQKVSKGQAIALIGNSGYSTGAHLHFEVIRNGQKVNPLQYVKR